MSTVGIDVSSLSSACNFLPGLCVPLGLAIMPVQVGGKSTNTNIQQTKKKLKKTKKKKKTKRETTVRNTRRK